MLSSKLSSPTMSSENESKNVVAQALVWLAIFITSICVFVPFSPMMPGNDLEQSWRFGIDQAVAQGLSFGKEMIFTYGPYASILTISYHPATDFMMLCGSLFLALSYAAYLAILAHGVQWRWALIYCAVLAGMVGSRDALLFSLPLLAGLSVFKIQTMEEETVFNGKPGPLYVALIFAPFGLLPLIKGSLSILCVAVVFLCFLLFMAKRNRLLALVCLCTPVVAMLAFWMASGQAVASLPDYFISMLPIVSGYTEAMANDGSTLELALYLAVSILMLLAISNQTQMRWKSRAFLACIYFVSLFVAFKAGFVRHDDKHAAISGSFILLTALLLQFVLHSRNVRRAVRMTLVFALCSWVNAAAYFESRYMEMPVDVVYGAMTTYSLAWHGLTGRIEDKNWARTQFDAAASAVRASAPLPLLQGTTDIYSYGQSALIYSGNTWSPRPILQSYSAYTPALAEINRQHLLGSRAPDNIIIKPESIDSRLASLDDGASWPILLLNYRPTGMANDYLLLRRTGTIVDIPARDKPLSQHRFFREIVEVPPSSAPIFAEIEINQTLLGRIQSFLFKPSQLVIKLEQKNGAIKFYSIIAEMTKSKFLISPLVTTSTEFKALYDANGAPSENQVKSIAILARAGRFNSWNADYTISFSQIAPAQSNETTNNKDLPDLRTTYRIRKF
ncbi:MAG: hypothetical protein P4L91_15430 [Burkholderiaceae bacterium]|nr:hypothetical protein [Burkholderiaceae bacterium]